MGFAANEIKIKEDNRKLWVFLKFGTSISGKYTFQPD